MVDADARLDALLDEVLDSFLRSESENIRSGTSERNLCGRLAIAVSSRLDAHGFRGFYADPEYNRKQNGQIKTIINEREEVVTVCCDLIVHTRGESVAHDNLFAVEMKKSRRPRKEKEDDRIRLRALTKNSYDGVWSNDGTTHPEHVCGYRLGIYLELNVLRGQCIIERYRQGHLASVQMKDL